MYEIENANNNLIKITTNYRQERVYEDEQISFNEKYTSKIVSSNTISITVNNVSEYYIGMVLKKNTELLLENHGIKILSNTYRIIYIVDNELVLENLDEAYCSIVVKYVDGLFFNENDFYLIHLDSEYHLTQKKGMQFIKEIQSYLIMFYVPIDVELFNNQIVDIIRKTSKEFEGMYIHKDFLFKEGEEYFAYKRVLINKEQYYEKIFVEYAYTMGDYVKIFSDKLKKGNVVISL